MGGQLEPGEGFNGHRIDMDVAHVAKNQDPIGTLEQGAETLAEAWDVGRHDRATNSEGDH